MKIAVIATGFIGGILGRRLAAVGRRIVSRPGGQSGSVVFDRSPP